MLGLIEKVLSARFFARKILSFNKKMLVFQIPSIVLTFVVCISAFPKARDVEYHAENGRHAHRRHPRQLEVHNFMSQKTMQSSPAPTAVKDHYEYENSVRLSRNHRQFQGIKRFIMQNKTNRPDEGSMVPFQSTAVIHNAYARRFVKRGVKGHANPPLQERWTYPARWSNVESSPKNITSSAWGGTDSVNKLARENTGSGLSSDGENTNDDPSSLFHSRPFNSGCPVCDCSGMSTERSYGGFALEVDVNRFNKNGESNEGGDGEADQTIPLVNSPSLPCPVCDCADNNEGKKLDVSNLAKNPGMK